jgi:hypothetical protein
MSDLARFIAFLDGAGLPYEYEEIPQIAEDESGPLDGLPVVWHSQVDFCEFARLRFSAAGNLQSVSRAGES